MPLHEVMGRPRYSRNPDSIRSRADQEIESKTISKAQGTKVVALARLHIFEDRKTL